MPSGRERGEVLGRSVSRGQGRLAHALLGPSFRFGRVGFRRGGGTAEGGRSPHPGPGRERSGADEEGGGGSPGEPIVYKLRPNGRLLLPGAPAGLSIEWLEVSMTRSLTIRIAWMALAPAAEGQIR
jgi:hypothetical protein